MTTEILKDFLMWNAITHLAIMALWLGLMRFAPEFFRRQQGAWFPVTKENFYSSNYLLYGSYKLAILIFVVIPYLALLIMGERA